MTSAQQSGIQAAAQEAARPFSGSARRPLALFAAVAAASVLLLAIDVAPSHAQRATAAAPVAGRDAAPSPLSAEALRARQELQQRARDLARELVGNMLDVQLKQLEQNGLQKLGVYRDIQSMQKNIDALIESDMPDVVALLVKTQQAEPKDRGPIFTQARAKIREIVTRLIVERQNLARRLRVAELAAQVRSLIEKQTTVRKSTESLSDQAQQRQVDLTLVTIQDQRDIKALFIQLVAALHGVSTWGGEVGAGAADGLRILQTGQAGQEVDHVGSSLEAAKFAEAAKSQQSFINTLKTLLDKLEGLQGLIGSSNEEALALVRDLEKRQAELRSETKQTDLQSPAADELVDQQTEIHKDLAKLNSALEKLPVAQAELEQAKGATYQATGNLFDAKQTEAIDEQTKALGDLAEIERQLQHAGSTPAADQSAAELAGQLENLKNAQQQVAESQARERQAAAEANEQPQQAAGDDQHAADALAKATEPSPLPAAVKSRLDEAKASVQDAGKAAQSAATPAAKTAARQSAQEAIERAAAEIAAAINDTQLNQKAVSVGELARAAEALERAASAEKQVAKQTAEAAKEGLTNDAAQTLAADQVEVKRTAEKVAEGVKDRAPEAAAKLDAAESPINAAGHDLLAAEKQPADATKLAAADVAKQAAAAADKLADAAADLRKEVAKEAGELANIAAEQAKPVAERRNDVRAEQAKQPDSRTAALAKLEEAGQKVAAAQAEQQRAAGRPEAAAAKQLAERIAGVARQQKAADAAAHALAQGKTDSSFAAATAEQKVAESAANVNKQAAARASAKSGDQDPIERALEKAQQAAAEAAKQTVAGSPQSADTARQAAGQALAEAEKAAQAEAQQASQAPSGNPDAEAQKAAGRDAAGAEKLAADAAPKAADTLHHAAEASAQAEKGLADKNQSATQQAQQAATNALEQAATQLAQAAQELAKKESGEVGRQAGEIGQLAKNTATIDPDAAAALYEAEKAAAALNSPSREQTGQADKPQSDTRQGDSETAAAVGEALQRADASLAARQQRLASAKDLAQQIAAEAADQQEARNEIVAGAVKLAEAAAQPAAPMPPTTPPASSQGASAPQPPGAEPPGQTSDRPASPAEQATAKALEAAERRFAETQSRIGENAEQVSGQTEVANKPIREGLEAASQLGQAEHPAGQEPGPHREDPQPGQGDQAAQAQPSQALGTGFVPNAPDATAKQIAGPEATAEAARAGRQKPGAGEKPGQGSEASSGQPNEQAEGLGQSHALAQRAGSPSSIAGGGGGIKSGQKTNNVAQPPGELQLGRADQQKTDSRTPNGTTQNDAAFGAQSASQEPSWLANLPPTAREAIRAKAHRPAPKVYEDRLKDYFENVQDGR